MRYTLNEMYSVGLSHSGLVHRLLRSKAVPGSPAGWIGDDGYWRARNANNGVSMAHRIIWEMHYGTIPSGFVIDHIDGNRNNNNICNLRLATNKENIRNAKISKNNTSGIKGVRWDKQRGKWCAFIKVDRRMINLGRYPTKGLAALSYAKASLRYFGKFARIECYPERFPI